LQTELPQVQFVSGPFSKELVDGHGVQAVYRSPGLSPETIAPVFEAARAVGISVGGELGLFSMALQSLRAAKAYAPAVLAITGTNGKTTVEKTRWRTQAAAGQASAIVGGTGALGRRRDAWGSHVPAAMDQQKH
jgi:UDP-N-acetylmuramoylalanine--D-glutamate ligase